MTAQPISLQNSLLSEQTAVFFNSSACLVKHLSRLSDRPVFLVHWAKNESDFPVCYTDVVYAAVVSKHQQTLIRLQSCLVDIDINTGFSCAVIKSKPSFENYGLLPWQEMTAKQFSRGTFADIEKYIVDRTLRELSD